MSILNETVNWYKGEIFEATIFGSFGLLLILLGVFSWKFGLTPNSKSIVIPVIVIGFIFSTTAISGIISNNKRLKQIEKVEIDTTNFVKEEIDRVNGFQYLYTMTKYIALVCFTVALCLFFFTNSANLQAIAIALIIMGLTGLVIDYFSKERADHYYEKLIQISHEK